MTMDPHPIGPETSHPPAPRRLLRAAALAVLAMSGLLLVRTGMKRPDPGKAASLIILGSFLAANAAPLLLSLKLHRNAASLRVLAVCGVIVDAPLFLVM